MLRKSSTRLDVVLAELAGRQWGVVSLAQLRALGIGSRAVQLRAQNGRLRQGAPRRLAPLSFPRCPHHPGLEVDCYFPTHRLVVETDGWDTHRTRQAFEDDRAKDAALLAAGYRVGRFTWRQLGYDPQTVADRLTAILGYTSASASRNSASSESSIE
jgi:very-short-patch-repair endonuclease